MLVLDETPYGESKEVLQVAPTGIMKASGMAALKLPVDAAAAVVKIAGGVESLVTGGESVELFKGYDEVYKPIQDWLTPEPGSVSTAGRFISGIAGFAPALALGPAGIPLLAGTNAINTGTELVEQGADPLTATGAAVLTGAAGTAMAGLPAAGPTIGKTAALMIANPIIGGLTAQAEKSLLEASGYEEISKQYDPLDPVSRGIDSVMALAFGAMGYLNLRRTMSTKAKDSIDTVANWQRMVKDTPIADDPNLSHKAMGKAISDLSEGKPVDLADVLPENVKIKTETSPIRAEAAEAKTALAEAVKTSESLNVEHRGQMSDDVILREALKEIPREKINEMLLTDPVSGARTRTAFDILQEQKPADFIGISDARGLGAIDKHLGHKAGDDFTQMIVKAHRDENVPIYRASEKGDEFITRWKGWTKEAASAKLEAVNERLRKSVLEVTNPDGSKRYFTNLELYLGLGGGKDGYNEAGHAVGEQKRTNQPVGYVKGEFPRHLVELSQERGMAATRGNRETAPGAETVSKVTSAKEQPSEAAATAPIKNKGEIRAELRGYGDLWKDPVVTKMEERLANEGDFPIRTGTDVDGAPVTTSVRDFIGQAKRDYQALKANEDIINRISDCV